MRSYGETSGREIKKVHIHITLTKSEITLMGKISYLI